MFPRTYLIQKLHFNDLNVLHVKLSISKFQFDGIHLLKLLTRYKKIECNCTECPVQYYFLALSFVNSDGIIPTTF